MPLDHIMTRRFFRRLAVGSALTCFPGLALFAGPITVPNFSFETPVTSFISVPIDSWQKPPQPADYDASGGFSWSQLEGIFKNTAPTSFDHIDNCVGDQAAWLFVVHQAGLFMDYDAPANHSFNAVFEPGKSYHMTIGIVGSGGGMQPGASLQLNLYYKDDADTNATIPAASAEVVFTPDQFPNNTRLVDCRVDTLAVRASDPWAGKHIGIQIVSDVATNLEGGYWDLDNVRLASILEPALSNAVITNGQFQFDLACEPGFACDIVSATNLAEPGENWTTVQTVTNATVTNAISVPMTGSSARFYRAVRRSP